MKRVNILISENYTTKKVAATKFTTGDIPVFDCSIHFGKEGNDVTLQNCHIKDNAIVKCSPDDIYDFEVGALIALMKMCGVEKVKKAAKETFFDVAESSVNEYEEKIHTLEKENNYLKYIKSCRESAIESLENTRDLLINKNDELIEENEKLKADKTKSWKNYQRKIQKKQDRINELNNIEERYIELREEYDNLFEDNEKLKHDYDLCKNSENALKCSVDYLNKTIAKLNLAIEGYKQETRNNNEYKYLESFSVVRRNGKQYEALVELFKKIDQKKVDAAYKEAYNTKLPLWQKEVLKQMYGVHKESKEWLYRIPTKREEMWGKIFELHKKDDVIIKVKKEDVNTFLHEIEKRFPEIIWESGVKIFEAKGTIKDIYEGLKFLDVGYFRLSKETKLSYSSDEFIYAFKGFKHMEYLSPMRWDLFKKGRIVVGVKNNNELEEFRKQVEINTGIKDIPTCPTNLCLFYSFDKDNYKIILESVEQTNIAKINGHKVYYWEDVRDKTTSMEDPYDTWKW